MYAASPDVALSVASGAGPQAELRIDNAVARVKVIPEARAGIQVAVQQGRSGPPLKISRDGAVVVVDGDQPQAGKSLIPTWMGFATRWFGKGRRCASEAKGVAVVTARVPLNSRVTVSGAISGDIGPSDSLSLTVRGCGDWQLGPVRRALSVDASSEGRVDAETVGGSLAVQNGGAGDVAIEGGHIPTARIIVLGTGNVTHRGSVGGLIAEIRSSGVVRVREVYGMVDAEVNGTGDVFYARPAAKRACAPGQARC